MQLTVVTATSNKNYSWIAILIFLAVFYSHGLSKVVVSSDSRWSIYVAESLLQDGDIELNEYEKDLAKADHYCIFVKDGKSYNLFPIGTSLLALPFVAAFDLTPGSLMAIWPGFHRFKKNEKTISDSYTPAIAARLPLERAIASFLVALSAVLIFLIGLQEASLISALLLTFVYSFCTSAWSTASRGLWQHGPSMLMLSLTLYLLIKAKDNERLASVAGLPLAFSYLVRPTNSISILVLSIYIFRYHREGFRNFLFFGALVIVPFVISNHFIYGTLLPPYFEPQRLELGENFRRAILGNLVSPGRGLFVFSPVIILSVYGVFDVLAKRQQLLSYALIIVVLHLFVISLYPHWWGGHSFGPRLTSDILPYLMLLMIPALKNIESGKNRIFFALLAFLTISASLFINFQGANNPETVRWNVKPVLIDEAPERLWDWNDLQFLR